MDLHRQSYNMRTLPKKTRLKTCSQHPLERQMPGDVEPTVSVSMETEEGIRLKHCRADRHEGKSRLSGNAPSHLKYASLSFGDLSPHLSLDSG